jgi:tetratricopeptide (TPR) repeat protein
MNAKTARFTLSLSLAAALLLAPFAAEAKPPKKPKPGKPGKPGQQQPAPEQPAQPQGEPARAEQTPPAGIDGIDERLWHYQTGPARDVLGRFMDQADANAYVSLAYGRVLDQEKKYGDAEGRLRKATELAPNDPAPFVYLGESYYQQRREGDANNAFRKAAEVAQARGGSAAAYYLGVAQSRLKQYDSAVATLEGAQAPQPALLPYQIGVARFGQGNWSAAAEQLNRAIEMDSGLAYAYYYRALTQDKLGHKDLLVNDMGRFLALAPNAPEAANAKAILNSVKR